ncbi:MAG TPA: TldD/PmbA family protein [Gemmatimonadales bacterium]
MTVLSREEMQAITGKIIGLSQAERIEVNLNSNRTGNTRFAANQLSTSGIVEDAGCVVQSWYGPKHAVVTTNDLSDESLRRAVAQSEALARLAPDDPEDMPALPAQTYDQVGAFFDATAALTPADRARAAMTALEVTRKSGDLMAAGFIITSENAQAIANSAGMYAYHASTSANYTVTVRTSDGTGSGWAGADHRDWGQLNFGAVSEQAIGIARLSRSPVAIEPGRYTVILEPQAVGDLVQLLVFAAAARSADEGRSPFVKEGGGNKIGEKILDERVSLVSDPRDPQLLGTPFDGQGLPLGRQVWIENGVLKQLIYSRFWAQKQGKTPTGFPTSIKMMGGTASREDMIASTPRGILVTRLWYLRQVDPRTVLYTGLTRDGTFLIENGKIARSIQNFRFNESPLFMLNNLEAVGPAERLAGTEAGGDVVMPLLKVRDFNFTSLSEAV